MEAKCPNCFYETDSWNDFVSINNVLECPECEDHFILEALTLKQNQQDRLNWDALANSMEKKVFRVRELEKKLATAVEALKNAYGEINSLNGSDSILEELEQVIAEVGGEDE